MGGLCSRRATEDGFSTRNFPRVNGHFSYGSRMVHQSHSEAAATVNVNQTPTPVGETLGKQLGEPFSFPELNAISHGVNTDDINDGIPRLSRALSNKSRSTRSKQAAVVKVCNALISSEWIILSVPFVLPCFFPYIVVHCLD